MFRSTYAHDFFRSKCGNQQERKQGASKDFFDTDSLFYKGVNSIERHACREKAILWNNAGGYVTNKQMKKTLRRRENVLQGSRVNRQGLPEMKETSW